MIIFNKLLIILISSLCLKAQAQNKWRVDLSQVPPDVRTGVLSMFNNASLENMNASEIDDLIKLIYLSAQYDPVRAVETSPGVIQIRVEKRVRIASVTFRGLKNMNPSEARRIVTAIEGDVFLPDALIRQGQNLQDAYKTMGFLNAEVDIEFPVNNKGLIDLNVSVRPGDATRIKKIQINIDNPKLKAGLEQNLKGYLKDILTQETIKELQEDAEKYLRKQKAFQASFKTPTIRLSQNQNDAFVEIDVQNASQYEFRIEGSTQLSSLLSLDDTLNLQDAPVGTTNFLPELSNRLRNYYYRKGHARIEVTLQEKDLPQSYLKQITFHVKEGPVVKIEKFQIQGKYSRSPEYYEKLILKNASSEIKRKLYIKEDLDQAVNYLLQELQNEGYLLAQIVSSRVSYNTERDRIHVIVNLNEGLRTSVKSVIFENAQAFDIETLQKTTNFKSGEPLQLSKIEQSIKDLKTLYKNNGYLEMMVLNERQDLVRYNEDNSEAVLAYRLYEGPQVKVVSIVVEGLRITKEYVVKFELDFKEGDLLTPGKIDESISRLQRTGYFSSVDIRTLEEKTEVANRTVLIRVTEADPGYLQIGVGVTNERDFTVRGYFGAGYRNLWGTGRGLSFRSDVNYNITDFKYLENRFTAGYLEPFLFDTRYKGRYNITRSNFITDYERRRATTTFQQTFSVEKDFTTHVTGVWDVHSWASSEDFNISGPKDKEIVDIASTGLTFDFDYRDNLVRPRKGHQARLSGEYGSPALGSTKTIEYVRSSASYTYYKSFFNDRFTWSNGVRYGNLQNLNNRLDGGVPYDKKGFFLGGPSTIRGFDPTREAFPSTTLLNDPAVGFNNKLKKTVQMYLLRSTFSYPIYGIVDGTVFYDGGEVQVGGLDLGFGYRHSAGVGILINTPVGPLNLEMGWKLGRLYQGEVPSVFHLSFGSF